MVRGDTALVAKEQLHLRPRKRHRGQTAVQGLRSASPGQDERARTAGGDDPCGGLGDVGDDLEAAHGGYWRRQRRGSMRLSIWGGPQLPAA